MHALTAAHKTLPFNTKLRVTNRDNGKVAVVRVNDRGPFKRGRILDLSLGAAKALDMLGPGTARVRCEVLE
jgi:rare lipoprotein A